MMKCLMKCLMTTGRDRSAAADSRRGVALLVVLSTITVALALSYAMLRSQTTQLIVEQNGSRTLDARQTAMAGMNLALQKMHDLTWAGVGTDLSGSLGANETYSVSFTTGDASLTPGDADYNDYPYRVTLLSTGVVTDPLNPTVQATHQIQAVVQLVPRKLSDAPASWSAVDGYALYQWGSGDVEIELPCQIDGPAYLSGSLKLSQQYPYDAKPFHGSIDEVAIYDNGHSDQEVLEIYQSALGSGSQYLNLADGYTQRSPIAWWRFDEAAGSTVATDAMGNHDGEYIEADPGVAGAPTATPSTAAHFDGIDDFVDVGAIDVSDDRMTIFAWIKADSFGSGDTRIISKAVADSDADHYWTLGTTDFFGSAVLTCSVKTIFGTYGTMDWTGNLVPGQWYFVALVLENNELRLYKNGVLVSLTSAWGDIVQQPLGTVFIGDDAPGSSRGQYLRDLNAMRLAGQADERPLTGPVDLPLASADADSLQLLQENLGVTTNDIAPTYSAPASFPSNVTTYQLYTGGKQYPVETLGGFLTGTIKVADPVTNPLGVFHETGNVDAIGGVNFEGTLLIEESFGFGGSLNIYSMTNQFTAVDLPPLHGTTEPIQLPVVIAENDVVAQSDAEATFSGMIWAGDQFEQVATNSSTAGQFQVEGSVVAQRFHAHGNAFWAMMGESVWQDAVAQFRLQKIAPLDWPMNSVATWSVFFYLPGQMYAYFPEMLEAALSGGGTTMDPILTLKPESTPVSYHWHDWSQPIFVPHPDDGGLRWDLIDWTDSP